jgi:hypothetical protein
MPVLRAVRHYAKLGWRKQKKGARQGFPEYAYSAERSRRRTGAENTPRKRFPRSWPPSAKATGLLQGGSRLLGSPTPGAFVSRRPSSPRRRHFPRVSLIARELTRAVWKVAKSEARIFARGEYRVSDRCTEARRIEGDLASLPAGLPA